MGKPNLIDSRSVPVRAGIGHLEFTSGVLLFRRVCRWLCPTVSANLAGEVVATHPEGMAEISRWLSAAIPPDSMETRSASRRDASERAFAEAWFPFCLLPLPHDWRCCLRELHCGGEGRGEGDFSRPLSPTLSPTVQSVLNPEPIVGEREQNTEPTARINILTRWRFGRSLDLPSVALGLLVLAFLTSSTCAQAPTAPQKTSQDPDLKGNLSKSLSFSRDREMETRLRAAHTALATGHSVDGVRILGEFLGLPEPHNIQVGTTLRDIREEATRLLRHGSAEVREQFRRETAVRAAVDLREARASGDTSALATVAARYPFTPTARECVETLAAQFYDHGQYDAVIQAAQRWVERSPDPRQAAQESPQLIGLWSDALREVGAADLAKQLAVQYPVPPGGSPFRSVGTELVSPLPRVSSPAVAVAWDVSSEVSPSAFSLLRKVLNDLSRQGVHPALVIRPLVLVDRIVWRSLTEIVCIDRHSGEVLWRKPIPDPAMESIAQLDEKSDPTLERRLRIQLGHRCLRNSILGQLSSDGKRVFCVQPASSLPSTGKPSPQPNPPPSEESAIIPDLIVVAYSLVDGSVQWTSQEAWGEGYRGTFPFGPPVAQGASLSSVVQQKGQLLILRMDAATGNLDESHVLGDAPLLSKDPRRMTQACPIRWHKGLALCATGAGAVAAFDVTGGQLSWGFRHARDDVEVAPGMLQPPVDRYGWSWMAGWQMPQLERFGRYLVHASPESNQIRCLGAEEGELRWEVPIAGAHTLVGGDEQRIVIAGSGFARALRMTDGHVEREYVTPVPVDSSSWVDGLCQLVLRDGRTIEWNPATGESSSVSSGNLTSREPWLAWAGSRLRIQGDSESSLIRIDRLGEQQLTTRVNGLSLRGMNPPLVPGSVAQQIPVEIDWDSRAEQTWPRPVADWIAVEKTYRDLHRALGEGELPTALGHVFHLLDQKPESWEVDRLAPPRTGPAGTRGLDTSRTVRLDAALRGILQTLWDSGTPEQRSALLQSYETWSTLPATRHDDRARPLEQLSFLPQRSLERPFAGITLGELAIQQLDLRRQAAPEAGPAAAAALWRLAELYLERGDWNDAAGLIEQLQRRFGDIAVRGGQTPRQIVKSLPPDSPILTRIDSDRRTAWPDRPPIVTSKTSYLAAENQLAIPIRAERGTMFDHLNVRYAPSGESQLEFSGLGKKKSWNLPLRRSNRDLRRTNPELQRGWAFGQFLVVQMGTELFCVSSLNDKGETTTSKKKDTILWPLLLDSMGKKGEPIDTLGNEDNTLLSLERRPVPQVVGFVRPETELFDAHGHRATWVGPVSAGTLCFLQQGMLVCLETATGRELWRRYDVPPGVRTFGDDGVILLTHAGQPTIDLLSPLDGRTLRSYESEYPIEELLKHWGRLALVASGQPAKGTLFGPPDKGGATTPANPVAVVPAELQLRMLDLSGPKTLWEQTFPPGSAAFEIDEEWLGVLTAEGQVVFLDIRTGQTLQKSKVEVPRGLQQIVTSVTERTIFVSLSSAVTEKKLINAGQVFQSLPGWRRAFVNGPVHAFDRLSGEYQWTVLIGNRTLPLDQVRDVPLLMCVDLWKESAEVHSRYWCLDARTGKVVLDTSLHKSNIAYTVGRDLEKGEVQLQLGMPDLIYTFRYTPPPADEK